MDVKAFSGETFDPADWVNRAVTRASLPPNDAESSTTTTTRESFLSQVSSLIYQLQLFYFEINSNLEQTALQVIHGLPSVLNQTQSLEEEITALESQIDAVKTRVNSCMSDSSVSAVNDIRVIHTTLEKMKECLSEVIQESRTPVNEVDQTVTSQDAISQEQNA